MIQNSSVHIAYVSVSRESIKLVVHMIYKGVVNYQYVFMTTGNDHDPPLMVLDHYGNLLSP